MTLERIAHRGFSAIAPENTLAAFSLALKYGADSIEFDLQLSADGVPVVFHDATLERLTGTPAPVSQTPLNILKTYDIGAGFHQKFTGEIIPTLDSALSVLKDIKSYLYFDIKPHSHWSDTAISSLLQLIQNYQIQDRCIITSFSHQFLQAVRQQSPSIKIGCLVAEADHYLTTLEQAKQLNSVIISSEYQILLDHPEFVTLTRQQGIDVVAWTVDAPQHWQRLINLGVTRIVTNSLVDAIP